MARKDRTLAGFGDVAGDQNNNNVNANDNVHERKATEQPNEKPDFLDKLLEDGKKKRDDLVLVGVYLQPEIANILDRLGRKGGRGAKSRIVNDALRKLFTEKDLL